MRPFSLAEVIMSSINRSSSWWKDEEAERISGSEGGCFEWWDWYLSEDPHSETSTRNSPVPQS